MFNRSKKYIILLIINIIIIIAVYVNLSRETDDPFDTDYVIGLLENEALITKKMRDLDVRLLSANRRQEASRTQLKQTQLLIITSEQKYNACEVEKQGIINDAKGSVTGFARDSNSILNSSKQCRSQAVELSVAQNRAQVLEQQLTTLGAEFTRTQEELILTNQLLGQAQDQNSTELETLRLKVVELENALKEPIRIEKNYLSARYCSKPKFAELICVQEFLVRPSFTKPPITQIGIKIIDANGNVVAEGEYNSAKSQLYRLTMGRGKELPSGLYRVIYSIDNETIRSKGVVLSQ